MQTSNPLHKNCWISLPNCKNDHKLKVEKLLKVKASKEIHLKTVHSILHWKV